MHFSAWRREIHCETTATRKVTVKPFEILTTAGTIDNLSIIDNFFLLATLAFLLSTIYDHLQIRINTVYRYPYVILIIQHFLDKIN